MINKEGDKVSLFFSVLMIVLGIVGLSMGILYEEPPIVVIGVGLFILGIYEKYINHIDRRLLEEGIGDNK